MCGQYAAKWRQTFPVIVDWASAWGTKQLWYKKRSTAGQCVCDANGPNDVVRVQLTPQAGITTPDLSSTQNTCQEIVHTYPGEEADTVRRRPSSKPRSFSASNVHCTGARRAPASNVQT